MACNHCNDCTTDTCKCGCKTTTTTTCAPVAEKPCITVCDDIFFSECIVYDGPDLTCYGINNGDTIKEILNVILEKLNAFDCSCTYGAAIIQNVTTTTSTIPPTTTTTTQQPPSLCFSIVGEGWYECVTENKSISPGAIINGKVSYSFNYQGDDFIIKWSITNNRWQLFNLSSNPTVVISYLESNSNYPIGPLDVNNISNPSSLVWKRPSEVQENYVITRNSCPQPLCFTIDTEAATDVVSFISYYDTLDNSPASPVSTKPYYLSPCSIPGFQYTVKWNAFTNVYELFYLTDKIAYANASNIETINYLNWNIFPAFAVDFSSISSKIGYCVEPFE
jgi:hypothetical protein